MKRYSATLDRINYGYQIPPQIKAVLNLSEKSFRIAANFSEDTFIGLSLSVLWLTRYAFAMIHRFTFRAAFVNVCLKSLGRRPNRTTRRNVRLELAVLHDHDPSDENELDAF